MYSKVVLGPVTFLEHSVFWQLCQAYWRSSLSTMTYSREFMVSSSSKMPNGDYVPLNENGIPVCARCRKNELWVSLLEKAYAKLHGSYESIEGGKPEEALEDLTGGVTKRWLIQNCEPELIWSELAKFNKGRLMGCSANNNQREGLLPNGLVTGHAYGILRVEEINGLRLIKIRNPWGQHEWNGRYSDGSKEWTPQLRQQLNQKDKNDGAFWMCFEDFMANWHTLTECFVFNEDWKLVQSYVNFETTAKPFTRLHVVAEEDTHVFIVVSRPDARLLYGKNRNLEKNNFGIDVVVLDYESDPAKAENLDDVAQYAVKGRASYLRSVHHEMVLPAGKWFTIIPVSERNTDLFIRVYSKRNEVELVNEDVEEGEEEYDEEYDEEYEEEGEEEEGEEEEEEEGEYEEEEYEEEEGEEEEEVEEVKSTKPKKAKNEKKVKKDKKPKKEKKAKKTK
eukprot:TRINITY_DN32_c6_g1_i2.p1 TRINITY_DN32_c6_g1~~TRINITY_DN32_c6_g1_i2.p1  ORF type:complete len:450 (-),score=111.83 TRINITY_DN32_c6_g1_i2:105-1454(-)